ncbi:MAG: PAS domain S-box protein [Actinomycetes bacterium]
MASEDPAISDVVCSTSTEGVISWVSDSVTALLGWHPVELVEICVTDLVDRQSQDALSAAVASLLEGQSQQLEAGFRKQEGSFLPARLVGHPVKDGGGNVTGIVFVLTDAAGMQRDRRALALVSNRYELLAESASDLVFMASADREITWVAPSVTRVLGWAPEDMVGHRLVEFMRPQEVARTAAERDALYSGDRDAEPQDFTLELRCSSGEYRWLSGQGRPTFDDRGRLTGIVAGLADVTDLVSARNRVESILNSGADPQVVLRAIRDEAGTIVDFLYLEVNDAACEYNKLSRDQLVGTRVLDLRPERRSYGAFRLFAQAVDTGKPLVLDNVEQEDPTNPGQLRYYDTRGVRFEDGLTLTWRDVTERHVSQVALARSEMRFRLALESAPIGMAVLDLGRGFVEVNAALCSMLGRSEEWMLARGVGDVLYPDDEPVDLRMREEVVSGRATSQIAEHRLVTADGQVVWVEHAVALLRDESGRPLSYVSQFDDVTESRYARQELSFRASHDPMTSLLNRGALLTWMDRVLAASHRSSDRYLAVLFCDLDGLKGVNDTYGHAAGDEVIIQTANRLRDQVRSEDVVARLGGDEMVIVLQGIGSVEAAERFAAKVQRAMAEPIVAQGAAIEVGISIGIALAAQKEDAEAVLARADRALYQAKRTGRSRNVTADSFSI